MRLIEDIKSNGKGSKLYAKKGDKVKLIGTHENVLIVELENGNRVSVLKTSLN